jgi:hypothetical protein
VCTAALCAGGGVTAYPIPAGEPAYDGCSLRVGGQPVAVYACRVSAVPLNQWWPGYQRPTDQTEPAGFAYWDMAGGVSVEVTVTQVIERVVVRPLSLKIAPEVEGQKISFTLEGPTPVAVEVNGYHNALHLFPNPVQTDVPAPKNKVCSPQCNYCAPALDRVPAQGKPRFIYFAPGVHDVGTFLLQSGDSVYVAGGAVVYGSLVADDVDNVRVWGRGVLDGSRIRRADRRSRGGFGCIHIRNSTNVKIEGIVLRDPNAWGCTIRGCREVRVSNIKMVGFWRYNADGIDVWNSRDVTIENCFIRSFDDCLVVRSTGANVRFNNCVLWCDWGKTIAVAVESGATTENVVFENLDMIRLCGHAMCIDHSCASSVHNIKFQNINVEIDDWVARPKIQENRDEQYVTKHDDDYCPWLMAISMKKNSRGSADNILFKDIEVYGNTKTRSVFRGVDEKHRIENVVIQNLRFNGKVIEDVKQANITIGSHVGSVRIGR